MRSLQAVGSFSFVAVSADAELNRKKTRCSGRQPCILCTRAGKTCEFTAAYTRGRLPSILPEENAQFQAGIVDSSITRHSNGVEGAPTDPRQMTSLPSPTNDLPPAWNHEDMTERHRKIAAVGHTESCVQSSRASPQPSQTDLQGHYVGPSSGVSFLLRVQKKLHQKVSFSQNSSIFTFGDAPLPDFDPSFFVLPPKVDAQMLVARYFDFAVATHRFLHRPTVETWLEEFYENLGVMKQRTGAKEKTALLFMVFAQAKEYIPGTTSVDTR